MIKKLSLAVCASLMGISLQAIAQGNDAVINQVANSNVAQNQQQSADLQTAFKQLKAQWQAQRMEDQKRLNASLAENKALANKLQALEARLDMNDSKSLKKGELSDFTNVNNEHFDVKHVKSISAEEHRDQEKENKFPTALRNRGGMIAYVADDSDFGKATTFESYPSSQVPMYLLQGRNNFGDRALVFGGYIEVDGSTFWGDDFSGVQSGNHHSTGTYNNGYNLNVTTATLDVMVNINEWIQTFWSLTSLDVSTPGLQEAFVTFGNFKESPLFVTVGKNRIPMGVWAGGGPWISGITQGYFRPTQFTNAMVGYYNEGLSLNFSAFVPEINGGEFQNEGDFMASIFYANVIADTNITYGFNAAYLYNWANTGMGANQSNPEFDPAGQTIVGLDSYQERNSVINIEGNIGYTDFAVFGGWAGLTKVSALTNNGFAGGWYIQPTFSPILFDQVTVFGVSWNQAYNMNNFYFPVAGNAGFGTSIQGVQKEFVMFVQRPIMTPQVLLGLEYGWLGTYTGAQTSEITVDLSVYF